MEGLLAYEDTATIIASIYVEQEQSEKKAARDKSTRNQTCLVVLVYALPPCRTGRISTQGSHRGTWSLSI